MDVNKWLEKNNIILSLDIADSNIDCPNMNRDNVMHFKFGIHKPNIDDGAYFYISQDLNQFSIQDIDMEQFIGGIVHWIINIINNLRSAQYQIYLWAEQKDATGLLDELYDRFKWFCLIDQRLYNYLGEDLYEQFINLDYAKCDVRIA